MSCTPGVPSAPGGSGQGSTEGFAERQRPALWFKFASSTFRVVGAEAAIHLYALRFQQLIEVAAASHPSRKVVVLIDEYGKPTIEYRNDVPRAEANRDTLEAFYGMLKDADSKAGPQTSFFRYI